MFALFFRVLLSKETYHRFNRVVLLATSVLAFILPLCVIVSHETVTLASSMPAEPMQKAGMVILSAERDMASAGASSRIKDWLAAAAGAVFILGALAVLGRTALSVLRIKRLVAKGRQVPQDDGTVLILVDDSSYSPFSWMKYIVMSEEDYASGNEGVIIHEKAHIALGHSWDIMIMELMTAMQWFNPAAWMLRDDLRAIHEYEADEAVVTSGTDMKAYQMLLVRKAVTAIKYTASNSLNHSTLKKRIAMMLRKRSSSSVLFKALYILPLIAVSLVANAEIIYDYVVEPEVIEPEVIEAVSAELPADPENAAEPEKEDPIPFQLVENPPKFNGGDANSFSKYINTRLVYPQEARDKGITGRVTLSFTVDKNTGDVTDVVVRRGAHPLLDAEAVRVVSQSPRWTPGSVNGKNVDVTYNFPIIFQLEDRN